MSTEPKGRHLIERAAERLRGGGNPISSLLAPAVQNAVPPPAMSQPAIPQAAPAVMEAVAAAPAETAPAEPAAAIAETITLDSADEWPAEPETPEQTAAVLTSEAITPEESDRTETTAEAAPSAEPPKGGAISLVTLEAMENAGLVVIKKRGGRTRNLEEFRIAESRVLRLMRSEQRSAGAVGNVLLVTSTMPAEGKSFTALNIAASMAQHERERILLVDIDAKDFSITQQLGLAKNRGVIDLMRDNPPHVEDVVVATELPNLWILPIGRRSRTKTGVPRRAITVVIEELARAFPDWVIVLDSPPCLATSDPSTLAPLVSQILMVVEAERTQKNELHAALDLIHECPNITLMLNKIQVTRTEMFGAYDYFGMYS